MNQGSCVASLAALNEPALLETAAVYIQGYAVALKLMLDCVECKPSGGTAAGSIRFPSASPWTGGVGSPPVKGKRWLPDQWGVLTLQKY